MPNVRRWRGLGGCGPQACHPSGGAAGDGTGIVGRVQGIAPASQLVDFALFRIHPLAVAENTEVATSESISSQALAS